MTTTLDDFTRMARAEPRRRFTSLMGMLSNRQGLRDSFESQPGNKAPGVDGMRKDDYANGAEERLADLSARLRRLGYRPKPARRVYIPKANGGSRPLGIPSFEDRIVQDRLSHILQAIWEPEFRECSFGFRPGRGAHDALRRLGQVITHEQTQWVVEADIKGFFNHVSHEHLLRFLEHRIGDPCLLRTIHRFLKAGVMEDGVFTNTNEGTPQGGLVSPVLANIYLHYVLDWWFEGKFVLSCRGQGHLVRYADDFVACFQIEADARRFLHDMQERLATFGLEVEPSKTALIRFGCYAKQNSPKDNLRRPATFNFLGITHYCDTNRWGRFAVGRITEAKRIRKKLSEVNQQLQKLRTEGGQAMTTFAKQHLQGHIGYFGITGNMRAVRSYVWHVAGALFKWLNRRSQKRSCTWMQFTKALRAGLLPKPTIIHDLILRPS